MAIASVDGVDYRPAAFEAVLYTKSKLTLGAGNKLLNVVSTLWAAPLCVLASRSVTRGWTNMSIEKHLRLKASVAESNGCGNCEEFSASAFIYLLDKRIRPLDWMALQDPGDHAFVVVGRRSGSNETDPKTWGASAVVCDPWKGTIYEPFKLIAMWKYKPYSIYRVDT